MKTIATITAIVSIGLSACTTGEKVSGLRTGMTRQQVVARLGQPDSIQRKNGYEKLRYTDRLMTGWSCTI